MVFSAIPQVVTEDRASGAQFIEGSLTINGSNQYLTRTHPASNTRTWTFSCWVKKERNAAYHQLFTGFENGANQSGIIFMNDDTLRIYSQGGLSMNVVTSAVYRDPGWMNVVVAVDTTQSTAADRVKLWVNGTRVTSFGTATYPSQNDETYVNTNITHYVGSNQPSSNTFYGQYAQAYFIDGQSLGPENFGYTDPLTNTWRPKKPKITGPNGGQVWSSNVTLNSGSRGGGSGDAAMFDGILPSSYSVGGNFGGLAVSPSETSSSMTIDLGQTFTNVNVTIYPYFAASAATCKVDFGGGDIVTLTGSELYFGAYELGTHTFSSMTLTQVFVTGGGSNFGIGGIAIDGVMLINSTTNNFGPNGFYLPMDGNTPIGKDQSGRGNDWTAIGFGGSVDLPRATGAIPVLNTNGGGTVAKGVRTDKKTYTVTASGGNYYLDGALKPILNAYRGGSYTFDYTGATSHPFYLSSLPDGKHNSKAYSVEFDGSDDYLNIGDSNDWDIGTNPFTIECFVNIDSSSTSYSGIFGMHTGSTQFQWRINNVGRLQFLQDFGGTRGNTNDNDTSGTDLRDNTWHHVALTRQSDNSWQLYVDGIVEYSGTGMTGNVTGINEVSLGRRVDSNANYLTGYISNLRFVSGTALYSSNFTPPTTTLTNVSGTILLCCQDSNATTGAVLPTGASIATSGAAATQTKQPFLYDNNHGNFGLNTSTSNTTKITIPHTAADTLYYYCNVHSGMGSSINVTTDIFKADPYAWKCMFAMASDTIDHSPEINVNSTASIFGDIHTTTPQPLRNFYGHSKKMEQGGGFRIDMELTTAEANAKHKFDTNDFTLECWFYQDGAQTSWQSLFRSASYNNTLGSDGIALYGNGQTLWPYSVVNTNGQNWGQTGNVVPYKKWNHAAWTRQGGMNRIFANGILVKTFNNSNSWDNKGWEIGDVYTWNGGYQDARIYNGVAKYTESFVVPATEPDVLPDTPSGITGKTNLTKITEGAVSFDGTGDCLTVSDNADFEFGSGDFTLEAFIYYTGSPGTSNNTYVIFSKWDNQSAPNDKGFILRISDDGSGDNLQWFYTTDGSTNQVTTGSTILSANKWYHVAFVRNGTTGTFYIDGVADATVVSFGSNSIRDTGNAFRIGANLGSGSVDQEFSGFISNARVVKGTALYTSNFTPPTEPLTEVTNTKLLCCQSQTSADAAAVLPDGQITVNNNSGTAGAYAPTGLTGGIVFPSGQGTSDHSNGMYLSSPSTSFAGNYTIEFWFNVDTLPSDGSGGYGSVFFDGRPTSAGNADNVFGSIYGYNTTGSSNDFTMRYHADSVDKITGSTNLSVGTWYHYALVRNNGTVTQYINGTADGSYSHSTAMISNADRPYIGGWGFGSGGVPGHNYYALDGKMSNLRMTSTAVYTANFTPPTSNLTTIPGTTFLGLQSTSSATDYTFVSGVLSVNGNAAANNFNPFTDDINTIRGQASGYATWNPLSKGSRVTLSNGNLDITSTASTGQAATMEVVASIGTKSGKYYVEWTNISNRCATLGNYAYGGTQFSVYSGGINNSLGGTTSGSSFSFTSTDFIALAVDFDNKIIRVYKNNFLQYTANYTTDVDLFFKDIVSGSASGGTSSANFGQKPFKFPPPDGFQPLNLSNVQPEKVIARPDQYVAATLFTGTGDNVSSRTVELPHAADLVWAKSRDRASAHQLLDTVRGNNLVLQSNSQINDRNPTTQYTGGGLSTIDGKTITIASGTSNNQNLNVNGNRGVIWSWKAGGSKGTFNVDDVGYANASDVNMNVGGLNNSVYNQTQNWTNNVSSTSNITSGHEARLFNGILSGSNADIQSNQGTSGVINFASAITGSKIEIYTIGNVGQIGINGSNLSVTANQWVDTGVTSLTSVETRHPGAGSIQNPTGLKVDGKILIDSGLSVTNVPTIAATGCSVGTKQGFSIIKYTGNTTGGATVSHGLSQDPKFIIIKNIDQNSTNWLILHTAFGPNGETSFGNAEYNMFRFDNAVPANYSSDLIFPGSNGVFALGEEGSTWSNGAYNYIAYCWHDVPGLQKFGKYTGNSSGDGTFVELGFRPALLWIKATGAQGNWVVVDTQRDQYNPVQSKLYPDYAGQENVSNPSGDGASLNNLDILSNGFKMRSSNSWTNSAQTYIYCAWAEAPTVNLYGAQANAR